MHFFCATDGRLNWLEDEFPQYLERLHSACKSSGKKFLSAETYEALLLTSKSSVLCIKYLLESGFFYVLTRNLSSDPVEVLFSALRQMAGCNDCLDARAVTFGLEKLLRTGILCASQASNVGNGQSVMSMYSPSTSTQLSRVDPAVSSGTSSGLNTSSIPQNTSATTSSALLSLSEPPDIADDQSSVSAATNDSLPSICEPPSFVDDVNSLLAPLKVTPLQRPPSTVETAAIKEVYFKLGMHFVPSTAYYCPHDSNST
ncbi:hypothetical protein V5799_025161 [Amblyomma americanum]|uniref:Uncharacterized protein n=1 Tax=Amblyomma americanum TaxID=6943 RepID=A0AAQ4EAD0_AMBAM